MRPLRILYFDHTAVLSGGEISLLDLVRALDKKLCVPLVVLGSDGPLVPKLRAAGVECRVLPLPASFVEMKRNALGADGLSRMMKASDLVGYLRRLSAVIRDEAIDIVHTNSLKSDLLGAVAARITRRPVVWHIRDRIADDYLPPKAAYTFRLLARVLPNCIIANSNATLATLELPESTRAAVVYSGVPRVLAEKDVAARDPSKPPRIGLIGRLAKWKGQHIFIEAAKGVLKHFPRAEFLIIGGPLFGQEEYEREIRGLADRLELGANLVFTGARDDVDQMITQLDVVVHASITGEPFGRVIVEAMAASKPVVATRGGGVPEIVVEGETGHLVPMGDAGAMRDAIVSLLSDFDRAREMGVRGRQRMIENFTIERSARQVEALYPTLLSASRLQ